MQTARFLTPLLLALSTLGGVSCESHPGVEPGAVAKLPATTQDAREPDSAIILRNAFVRVTDSATIGVGPAGGELTGEDGLRLEVPANALDAEAELTARPIQTRTPDAPGITFVSDAYAFTPHGTHFDTPVTITLPFEAGGDGLQVYRLDDEADLTWSLVEGVDFEDRHATFTTDGFSIYGIGCTVGESCCELKARPVDLLFVIDDSGSMREEQTAVIQELPDLVRVLTSGDLDGDGTQDFLPIEDLRVAVISTNMGTSGFPSEPARHDCRTNDGFGQDGILTTDLPTPRCTAKTAEHRCPFSACEGGQCTLPEGCAASYDPYLTLASDDNAEDFLQDVTCKVRLGTTGCGLEQQLEASLKALMPANCDEPYCDFVGSSREHDSPGANAGFLRADSVLAVVLVTDEDDCSVENPAITDDAWVETHPKDGISGHVNLRCVEYAEELWPVVTPSGAPERYAPGLLSLRTDPKDLVFAAIAGFPGDLVEPEDANPLNVDYEALLAGEAMEERLGVDPSDRPYKLLPSCTGGEDAEAYPPRRIGTVAKQLHEAGAGAVVASICEDLHLAFESITWAIARALRQSCR